MHGEIASTLASRAAEIEVYDASGANVALGARVLTSEEEPGRGKYRQWYAGDPSLLTNGQRSFLPPPGIWHSAETSNNYIEVFLPQEVLVQAVVIFNRPDCCQERFVGAVVSLWTRDGIKVWGQRIQQSKMSYAMFPRSQSSTCRSSATKAGGAVLPEWSPCGDDPQSCVQGTSCRVGDRRCLTDASCAWANQMDRTQRDCTPLS